MEIKLGERVFDGVWRIDVYQDEKGLFHRGRSNERLEIIPQPNGKYQVYKKRNCSISEPLEYEVPRTQKTART
jgi:hypothetical protein